MKHHILFSVFITVLVLTVCASSVSLAAERDSKARQPRAQRAKDPIKAGMQAPDFMLLRLGSYSVDEKDGNRKTAKLAKQDTVSLSSFAGKRPVVLFFSSYT